MDIKLYKHQQDILDRNPSKYLLAWQMGTGKTFGALALANHNKVTPLILCPKSLKEQWEENVEKWGMEATVMTKETFRRDWKDVEKFDAIVIDEAHFFAGMKSQMSKNLIKYIKKHDPQYIWALTATPYMSTPWNIYRLAQILGHEWHYWRFDMKFFNRVNMGGRVTSVVKKGIENEVADLVEAIGETVAMEDCVDVPEQVFTEESFALTAEQKRAIKQLKEEEYQAISVYTKSHQICGGTLKGNEYEDDQVFKCEKVKRAYEICQEQKKVAIVCRYNLEIEALQEALKKLKKKIYVITGQTKDRHEIVKKADESDECIVLINAACAEGYELPSINICVFFSLPFSFVHYRQLQGRFLRMNKLSHNLYVHFITKDSIDEAVYAALKRKEDFDIAIYSKENL